VVELELEEAPGVVKEAVCYRQPDGTAPVIFNLSRAPHWLLEIGALLSLNMPVDHPNIPAFSIKTRPI
jgi:hypothetical protein